MSIIPEEDASILRELFSKELQRDVALVLFKKNDPSSDEAEKLLREVSSLSEKISLKLYDLNDSRKEAKRYGIARAPAVTILGEKDHGIRYYGVPFEQEFETLIFWLLSTSNGRINLREETKRSLEEIKERKKLIVLVTYACPHCPLVAQRAIEFAIACDMVEVDIIDLFEFPEVKKEFPVLVSTPKVFAGDRTLTGPRGSDEDSLLGLIK